MMHIAAILFIFVLVLPTVLKDNAAPLKPHGCQFLSRAAAEKILGQAARITENKVDQKGDVRTFRCTYTAAANDPASGRSVNLIFMLEENANIEQAQTTFESIRKSNQNHAGFTNWLGVADEALVHSERPNFHFVMVRKGRYSIRVKVNKAVESTSLDEVKNFVSKLVAQF